MTTGDPTAAQLQTIAAKARLGQPLADVGDLALVASLIDMFVIFEMPVRPKDRRDQLIRQVAAQFYGYARSGREMAHDLGHDLAFPERPIQSKDRNAVRVVLMEIHAHCQRHHLSVPGADQLRNILKGARTPGKGR